MAIPPYLQPLGHFECHDLNTGRYLWKIPFGEYPELADEGMKNTGTENYGGPIVTAGGIVFIGATIFDRKMHAFDSRTGKLLWETSLPFAGHATPATYMIGGKQYVVIAAGGGRDPKWPSGGIYASMCVLDYEYVLLPGDRDRAMIARPRTSTLVLIGLFIAVLALWILVRPDPVARAQTGSTGNPGPALDDPCAGLYAVVPAHAVADGEPDQEGDPVADGQPVAVGHAVTEPDGHAGRHADVDDGPAGDVARVNPDGAGPLIELTGPVLTGPVLTSTVLTGTVWPLRRRRRGGRAGGRGRPAGGCPHGGGAARLTGDAVQRLPRRARRVGRLGGGGDALVGPPGLRKAAPGKAPCRRPGTGCQPTTPGRCPRTAWG